MFKILCCFEGIFVGIIEAVSKRTLCDASQFDHIYRRKYANAPLFSLLFTPDLLLKNIVISISSPLMMGNQICFLHNAFSVQMEDLKPQTSREV